MTKKFDTFLSSILESDEVPKRIKLPKGYSVKVVRSSKKKEWYESDWYDAQVIRIEQDEEPIFFRGEWVKPLPRKEMVLMSTGTMFETKEKAWEAGASRAWDIFNGKSEWS
jgi:hypothetical protein